MADWTDGPEYAPLQPPDAFVAPTAAPLGDAVAAPALPSGEAEAPEFSEPAGGVSLDLIAQPGAGERDPRQAFEVAATALTAPPSGVAAGVPSAPLVLTSQAGVPVEAVAQPSAWGSVHAPQATQRPAEAWAPQQPMALPDLPPVHLPPTPGAQPHVNPDTFDQSDRWYSGYGPAPLSPYPQPVTLGALWEAATPGVLVSLFVGGLVPLLSPLCLIAAALFAQRLAYRRSLIVRWLVAGVVVSFVVALLGTLAEYGVNWHQLSNTLGLLWDLWTAWAPMANWLLLAVVLGFVSGALRRGEPPQTP